MASTGEVWKLGHRPALDGVRGIAVLLVLVCHIGPHATYAAGPAGVTIFFTLSGFLITALLLEERERSGRVSLRRFYRRRALRLMPALYACIVAVLAAGVVLGPDWATLPQAVAAGVYLSNWVAGAGLEMGPLNHTWSLSIEEQFYLVWPVVLLASLRLGGRRAVAVVAILGSVVATVARVTAWNEGAGVAGVYFPTHTRADSLLIGCLLAVVMGGMREGRSRPGLATAALLVLPPLSFVSGFGEWVALPSVAGPLAAVVIFCVARGAGSTWLSSRPLVWVGRRSYGLYLWHVPVVKASLLMLPGWVWWQRGALVLPLAVALTVVSWRYLEQPFLQLSKSLERRDAIRRAGLSGDAVDLKHRAGGQVLA